MKNLVRAARNILLAVGELPPNKKLIRATFALQEALSEQAEHDRNYGELADTHNWTPPNYTDEQWQKLDQEYQDHVTEQEFIELCKAVANQNSLNT